MKTTLHLYFTNIKMLPCSWGHGKRIKKMRYFIISWRRLDKSDFMLDYWHCDIILPLLPYCSERNFNEESKAQSYNPEKLCEAITINQSRRGRNVNNFQSWSWLFIGSRCILLTKDRKCMWNFRMLLLFCSWRHLCLAWSYCIRHSVVQIIQWLIDILGMFMLCYV